MIYIKLSQIIGRPIKLNKTNFGFSGEWNITTQKAINKLLRYVKSSNQNNISFKKWYKNQYVLIGFNQRIDIFNHSGEMFKISIPEEFYKNEIKGLTETDLNGEYILK